MLCLLHWFAPGTIAKQPGVNLAQQSAVKEHPKEATAKAIAKAITKAIAKTIAKANDITKAITKAIVSKAKHQHSKKGAGDR